MSQTTIIEHAEKRGELHRLLEAFPFLGEPGMTQFAPFSAAPEGPYVYELSAPLPDGWAKLLAEMDQ